MEAGIGDACFQFNRCCGIIQRCHAALSLTGAVVSCSVVHAALSLTGAVESFSVVMQHSVRQALWCHSALSCSAAHTWCSLSCPSATSAGSGGMLSPPAPVRAMPSNRGHARARSTDVPSPPGSMHSSRSRFNATAASLPLAHLRSRWTERTAAESTRAC